MYCRRKGVGGDDVIFNDGGKFRLGRCAGNVTRTGKRVAVFAYEWCGENQGWFETAEKHVRDAVDIDVLPKPGLTDHKIPDETMEKLNSEVKQQIMSQQKSAEVIGESVTLVVDYDEIDDYVFMTIRANAEDINSGVFKQADLAELAKFESFQAFRKTNFTTRP